MPDITMCNARAERVAQPCPMREHCYRYLATPSGYRQAFFTYAPFIIDPDGASCEFFWKVENENK